MNKVRVPGEVWRSVKWLLVGALVAQLVIVPWASRTTFGQGDSRRSVEAVYYGSIFVPPQVSYAATGLQYLQIWRIAYGRLVLHLLGTAGLLVLWLAFSEARDGQAPRLMRKDPSSPEEASGQPSPTVFRSQ